MSCFSGHIFVLSERDLVIFLPNILIHQTALVRMLLHARRNPKSPWNKYRGQFLLHRGRQGSSMAQLGWGVTTLFCCLQGCPRAASFMVGSWQPTAVGITCSVICAQREGGKERKCEEKTVLQFD